MTSQKYVVGVDGGGTKTIAALADLKGKILKIGKAGSSNPTNVGIKTAVKNISQAINLIIPKKGEISSTFIGLPAVAERPELKKKIKNELLKDKKIAPIFRGKLKIESDQIVAFRCATDQREGVLIISGTGCVGRGWSREEEAHASGWGWLADEGSAFWIGQKVFQAVLKDLDGRGERTLLTKFLFQNFKLKKIADLINLVYLKNPPEVLPQFSAICDRTAKRRDRVAQAILKEAGEELALVGKTIIWKLSFQNKKFPLVLVGSIFKSKIVLETVKKEIKKFAPKTNFILPTEEPVIGAIKLAIEQLIY